MIAENANEVQDDHIMTKSLITFENQPLAPVMLSNTTIDKLGEAWPRSMLLFALSRIFLFASLTIDSEERFNDSVIIGAIEEVRIALESEIRSPTSHLKALRKSALGVRIDQCRYLQNQLFSISPSVSNGVCRQFLRSGRVQCLRSLGIPYRSRFERCQWRTDVTQSTHRQPYLDPSHQRPKVVK